VTFGKTDQGTRRVSGFAAGTDLDRRVASIFVTAPDGLSLHVRRYGSRVGSALPVVCLPGLARTAADFHPLAAELAADPAKPRLVLAIDYRGHGQSEYDRNPDNYTLPVALADLSAVLIALEMAPAIFLGTSYGGLLAMMLAVWRPTAIGGAILNDIGPVSEPRGWMRIKGYVGKLPVPRNFEEGAEILRWWFHAQFPKLTPQDWIAFAQRTWREDRGRLVPDYDPKLTRTLQGADLQHLPTRYGITLTRDAKKSDIRLIARSFPISSQSAVFDAAASSRSAKFCSISARCRCRNDGG
jgi:pimeloyl-ACP methyl ester carboxylesterase